MAARIVVLGSINMDLVVRSHRLPAPGETILGGEFETHPGGKGANQAVAAARLGAHVTMIGCVGDDEHGRALVRGLQHEGLDTRAVRVVPRASTGTALITVSELNGENTIVVAPGANSCVAEQDVVAAMDAIREANVVLMQLEVPLDAIRAMMARDEGFGALTILNAAPAKRLDTDLLSRVDVLVVNESEARTISGARLDQRGVELALMIPMGGHGLGVVTFGAQGATTCVENHHIAEHPAFAVDAVDTTGAGDAFCGALAVRLAELGTGCVPADDQIKGAIRFASAAAAIACTRHGAQPSLPTRGEVLDLLRSHGGNP